MRTSEHAPSRRSLVRARGFCLALAATLAAWTCLGGMPEARDATFASPKAALEQGQSAFKHGYYEIAIPALTAAVTTLAADQRLFAQFDLAQIYADSTGSQTDHIKAYTFYRQIVEEHGDVDPDDRERAKVVAKALTSVATYVRRGLPEYGLTADIEQAVDFYNKAATWFDEADAQFELAKLYLVGEGVPKDVKLGLYYLQKLTQQSHAPAQAFLADLHWQGKLLPREPNKALALIRLAVANAPRQERLWIEDIYQKVYCGTSSDVRSNADGLVMRWQRAFGPQAAPEPAPQGGADGELKPARACHNGEPVEIKNGLGAGDNPFSNFAPSAPDLRLGTKPVGQPGPR